jgi:hypothetical protein
LDLNLSRFILGLINTICSSIKIASVDWKSLDIKFLISEFRSLFRGVLKSYRDSNKLTDTGDLKKPFKELDGKSSVAHTMDNSGAPVQNPAQNPAPMQNLPQNPAPGQNPPIANIVQVLDPMGQGIRGYIDPATNRPFATSQPYARNLAAAMQADSDRQGMASTAFPNNLGANELRFFRDFIRHHHPNRPEYSY